jgi:methionyl-tRNA formyltransferase
MSRCLQKLAEGEWKSEVTAKLGRIRFLTSVRALGGTENSALSSERHLVLTVAFFGSGGQGSMIPLGAISKRHRVIALVRPAKSRSGFGRVIRSVLSRSGIGERAVMSKWANMHDAPLLDAVSGRDPAIVRHLKTLAPDVICVSAFPWLLSAEILSIARCSAFNVHASLLPRHRGPNPLLWIYYRNDRRTGVTVHRMNRQADAGEILAQQAFDLPRGFPVEQLYSRKALLGGELLLRVLDDAEAGNLKPVSQDEHLSTHAPRVAHGVGMVDFGEWDVERVWHFLSGLCSRRREPLQDDRKQQVRYRSVLGYTPGDCNGEAGEVRSAPFGWNLYCRDGSIQLGDGRTPL